MPADGMSICSDAENNDGYVYVMGTPIGVSIGAGGLIVQDSVGVSTKSGEVFPASCIQKGDVIISVDGEELNSIYKLKLLLDNSSGSVRLKVARKGNIFFADVTPVEDSAGAKRIGLMLKEDIGGIGTLTFVTPEGRFGALGHFISDEEAGLREELTQGKIYPTSIDGVIKGEKGKAGGLQAEVNRLQNACGKIESNTLIGIYGEYNCPVTGELMRVAGKGEAKMGAAKVLATIKGDSPEFYDIDIVKVISQSSSDEKGMVIAVKDKRLLEEAGGIVQGMSGSPIIQNGMFIGAVTHVFLQDPTRGYAVHGRFMLENALDSQNRLAA